MITWKIWQQLKNPVSRHPLVWRVIKERTRVTYPPLGPGLQLLCGIGLCVSMLSPIGLIFSALLFLLVTNSTGYTVFWTAGTSGRIARLQTNDQYDLMCTAPGGKLGLHWAVCTGVLQRDNRLDKIHTVIRVLLLIALGIVLLTLFSSFSAGRQDWSRSALALLNTLGLLAAVYMDHIQSVVCGSIVGMLVPLYIRRPIDARIAAVALYVLVQAFGYILAILAAIDGVNIVFAGSDHAVLITAARLLVFVGIREAIIAGLWRWLLSRSETTLENATIPYYAAGVLMP